MSQVTHLKSLFPTRLADPVCVPVYQTCTFRHKTAMEKNGSRLQAAGSKNTDLADVIAKLGNGSKAVVFGYGPAAIHSVLKLLKKGDEIMAILPGDALAPEYRSGIRIHYSDTANAAKAISPETKLIWFQTAESASLKVSDIQATLKSLRSATVGMALIIMDQPHTHLFRWELVL